MNSELRSKLPATGTTIFATMSKLAADHGALNLGQGFPDFPIDPVLGDLVRKFIAEGRNQYAPMAGVMNLREAISDKVQASTGRLYSPENEVTITAGGTQALFTAITALVHPGDEVILFAPAYDCYAPAVELQGATPIWIELTAPDYRIRWDDVAEKMGPRTRMIIINSPHNPTGSILQKEDMLQLQDLVADSPVIVLSDEVYEHILFDGKKHTSCASFPILADRSLIVYSFGKTYHVTGWKMGYTVGPERLMREFRKVHQFNVFSVHTPSQYAFAEYMTVAERYTGLADFYQAKRDLFIRGLEGSRFAILPSAGTYFQLLGFSQLSEETDLEFAKRLTIDHGITGIPCSVFYPNGRDDRMLRFCFAKEEDVLIKAATILSTL